MTRTIYEDPASHSQGGPATHTAISVVLLSSRDLLICLVFTVVTTLPYGLRKDQSLFPTV